MSDNLRNDDGLKRRLDDMQTQIDELKRRIKS